MSAASLLETTIVIHKAKGMEGVVLLHQFITDAGIAIVEFTASQSRLAFEARISGLEKAGAIQLN